TIPAIAIAMLGDARHATFLADLNKLPADGALTAGTEVEIPPTVQHVSLGGEPLSTIALAYYGDAKHADLLRTYNALDHDTLGKAYLAAGDDAKALDVFQRTVKRKPDHVLGAFAESPKVRDAWKRAGGKVDSD